MNSRNIRIKLSSILEFWNSVKAQYLNKMKEVQKLAPRGIFKSMLQEEAVIDFVEEKNKDILAIL